MKVNCSLILFSNCSPTWPLSTGLCDESRNLLFYLYTLQSKTLTITNDVDVSITKYFLERRWQINVINKGRFFFSLKENLCYFVSLYLPQNIHPYSKMCELCELCELLERHPTALAMGLASLINIYVCEIVYLFQDQTFYLAAIVGEEVIGITCDYSSNAVSNPSWHPDCHRCWAGMNPSLLPSFQYCQSTRDRWQTRPTRSNIP